MTTDYNLCFIRNKLASIKNATMYTMGNQALPLPNDIVMLLRVDDEGQLWFTGHKPRGFINNYEQCFPAKLLFYQKGVEYYIEARGNTFIANNEDILSMKDEIPEGTILLKMTPSLFEYTEPRTKTLFSALYKWYSSVSSKLQKIIPLYSMNRSKLSGLHKTKGYG